ncbi:MAG: PLP-dependent aminotransferase family protein [Oscillospiraceae bacterium]|nr:PLP-dependent aminotransferase family protein [Oscillospiraceae bacterium]
MNIEYAKRVSGAKPSIIREILKQMNDPTLISFAGGNPAPESFPIKEIRRFSDECLRDDPVGTLQYSLTEGYTPLRQSTADFINRKWTVKKETDDLIITSGSQQAIDFLSKILCNEGDVVLCEEASYVGALNAIRSYGVKTLGVPNDETGTMDMQALEKALAASPKPKFLYVIPNFQNPMGTTLPAEKRAKIYELAVRCGVPVFEDNPYGDLRYSGEALPPIKSLDTEGAVVYAASFSKIFCPGMRISALVADKGLMARLVVAKQCGDVHSNVWSQKVCDRMLRECDMDGHIARLQAIYREKSALMLREMDKHFSRRTRYTRPEGGMFIWVTLPDEVDMLQLVDAALKEKVAVVPGSAFSPDEEETSHCFRMNFSTPSNDNIIKGVEILGRLTKRFCGE